MQAQQASGSSGTDLDTLSEALFRQLATGAAGVSTSAEAAPDIGRRSQQQQAHAAEDSVASATAFASCVSSCIAADDRPIDA